MDCFPDYTFKDPPEPKERQSLLAQLGIELPEKRVPAALTEEEQRKADELASEYRTSLTLEDAEAFAKMFVSEISL